MRKVRIMAIIMAFLFTACAAAPAAEGGVAATTAPVAQFAAAITEGTDVPVHQVITDAVSCLHDYSLSVRQMETVERSDLVLLSGAGLEDFMEDVLAGAETVDCSAGVVLRPEDPHIWLDPDNACIMAENICTALCAQYPAHASMFSENTLVLQARLQELKQWGLQELSGLGCDRIITFHDGFGYLADAFSLEILAAVEEESGSEASAADLTEIIGLVEEYGLSCVFTEVNGSDAAASVICAETGAKAYTLDTAMGSDYFAAMEHNIRTLKEALQ